MSDTEISGKSLVDSPADKVDSSSLSTLEDNDRKVTEKISDDDDDDDDGLGLFGDEDDEEEEEQTSSRSKLKIQDEDDDEDVDVDNDNDDEELGHKIDEADLKTLEISLVRHSKSHSKLNDEAIKLQIPTYIGIDAHPFDPTKFEESVQTSSGNKTQELDDKLLAENTIRWRYSTNKQGDVYRQSNTQIIEWDDGSYSLKLGSEIFDVVMRSNEDNFLVMTHDDQDILQTQEVLTRVAKIVPTSTSSVVHKRLTKAITNRQAQQKQHKMKSIILKEDPELRLRALEKLEEESIKARRRAELKRIQEEERLERGSPAPSRSSRPYYGSRVDEDDDDAMDDGIDVRRNEYDDDDGFIDDDEEDDDGAYGDENGDEEEDEDELDKAAERLRKVKEAGAAKYSSENGTPAISRSRSESEDDKVSRKKRRIISDDDEEED